MIKQRLKYLAICAIISIGFIVVLFEVVQYEKNKPNDFIRSLPPHLIVAGKTFDLKSNSFYIAGLSADSIYLASFNTPYFIMSLDYHLIAIKDRKIMWTGGYKISKSANLNVNYPFIYLNDDNEGRHYKTNLDNLRKVTAMQILPYTASAILNQHSFVDRIIDNKGQNQLIWESGTLKSIKIHQKLLENQGDGIFSSDGVLFHLPETNYAVYLYHYRNQFLCIDSNLNLVYRGKTIDTISHVHISVSSIKSKHEITMASPPLMVNRTGCANEKYIFINSGLSANNEKQDLATNTQIIDVYNTKNGKYEFSFYLPPLGKYKAKDFKVYGGNLVAIYDHFVTVYKLNFK